VLTAIAFISTLGKLSSSTCCNVMFSNAWYIPRLAQGLLRACSALPASEHQMSTSNLLAHNESTCLL
jgi:hypothetical protein